MRNILLILLVLCLASCCFGTDWFVKQGQTGADNGTSYNNAWEDLVDVVWGGGGVNAGDTLYVCGLHLYEMTSLGTGLTTQADITPISGSEGSHIIIRGDYPGDAGIVWGAFLPTYLNWSDQTGYYSLPLAANYPGHWWFADITAGSWTVLIRQGSEANCKANNNSVYYNAGTDVLYVNLDNGSDPTNKVYLSDFGYDWCLDGLSYLTFKNLTIYNIENLNFVNDGETINSVYFEGCKIWYGIHSIFSPQDNCDDIRIIDCDLAWAAAGGIYTISSSNSAPSDYIFRGNYIHDIGVWIGDGDAHGIGIQGGDNGLIEGNLIKRCGTGITFYAYTNQTLTNTIVRYNYIADTHTNGGCNDRGMETQCSNDSLSDKTGNTFYYNTIVDCAVGSRFQFEDEQTIYNNTFVNCGLGLVCERSYDDGEDKHGPNIKLRNNVFFNNTKHIYWASSADTFTVDSNYNLFYPVVGDVFYWNAGKTLAEWQALGGTYDLDSLNSDPLFLSVDGGNFKLLSDSPAIDAGVDVGLTEDCIGTSIPQGEGVDIGANEYKPGIRRLIANLFLEN